MSAMLSKALPPASLLRELFIYEPDTGLVRHAVTRGRAKAGVVVGSPLPKTGYLYMRIYKEVYQVHRVVWKIMTGEDPVGEIDHINGLSDDNRWENLRCADRAGNMQNVASRGNIAGLKGVARNRSRWAARIRVRGKLLYLGTFDTPEQAHSAYVDAALRLHGDFANIEVKS